MCDGVGEVRAMWGRGQAGTLAALQDVELRLPFALLGLDSDNGGEFLNHHLLSWLQRRVQPVFMTRSRPYKKDNNAHVEQKNWTHIRQGFGYERHDNSEAVELMNELARGPYRQLLNYFHAECLVLMCAIRGVPRELPEAGRGRMNANTDRTSDERAGFAKRGGPSSGGISSGRTVNQCP